VPGAVVRVVSVELLDEKDGLKELYKSWNTTRRPFRPLAQHLPNPAVAGLPREVKADAKGRFEISGVGDGRLLTLEISADTIETVTAGVAVHSDFDAKAVRAGPARDPLTGAPRLASPLYGPTFDHAAKPCRVIQGRVFDQKTKKPLSDVAITAFVQKRTKNLSAVSDAAGRYRIAGLPGHGECDVVFNFRPSKPTSYLTLIKTVAASPGLAPVTVEMPLVRGTVVTGRVTDRKTGNPLKGGVTYFTLAGNKHVLDLPGKDIHEAGIVGSLSSHTLDADGRFRFVAPPGPGIITFKTFGFFGLEKAYPPAVLRAADRKKPYFRSDPRFGDAFLTTEPATWPLRNLHGYRVIEPAVGEESLTADLQLDAGKSIAGKVVAGPDDKPLEGVTMAGLTTIREQRTPLKDATFTIQALVEDDSRTVVAVQRDKKLAAATVVRGNEKEPLILKLADWGAVTGRVVDKDGAPLAGATLFLAYSDRTASTLYIQYVIRGKLATTDAAGKFRIDAPFAGIEFGLSVRHKDRPSAGPRGITIKAGQTKALDDIVVKEEE
jgi:hypothetical protein